jgi:orotidine-5'-phosphate decarboxylase
LLLGVDPDPSALWPCAQSADAALGDPFERAAAAVARHCRALIDATAEACVGVKFQLACFERLQAPGWRVLAELVAYAKAQELLVIADGKRGDVPVSAAAYAQALFGPGLFAAGSVPARVAARALPGAAAPGGGLGVDAATVNPLLGLDSLVPFLAAARASGAGVFALLRTSNDGARDLQELRLQSGELLWERIAALLGRLESEDGHGGGEGLSEVGAVVGATAPELLARARALLPHAVFLLPGVGAQGGDPRQLGNALAKLPGAAAKASILVAASRSIAGAWRRRGGDPAEAAHAAARELRDALWSL